ncbi:unnamed protein product [Ilex paraguariensis]|uniref:Uncharacterized protein n=1 Tax=Ilex paraguariensis TaxID=185542 RepID=A0ABC8QP49_9AQUA
MDLGDQVGENGRRRKERTESSSRGSIALMVVKNQSHHMVAVRLNEQSGKKKKNTFINRFWLPKITLYCD